MNQCYSQQGIEPYDSKEFENFVSVNVICSLFVSLILIDTREMVMNLVVVSFLAHLNIASACSSRGYNREQDGEKEGKTFSRD